MKTFDFCIVACVMDLLHEGHMELIYLMCELSDEVVLFVHDDYSTFINKRKFPVQSCEHRIRNLKSLGIVKEIIKVDRADPGEDIARFIESHPLKKIGYVRGDDTYEFPGKDVLHHYNIPIIYKRYTEGVSSTRIRDNLNK